MPQGDETVSLFVKLINASTEVVVASVFTGGEITDELNKLQHKIEAMQSVLLEIKDWLLVEYDKGSKP